MSPPPSTPRAPPPTPTWSPPSRSPRPSRVLFLSPNPLTVTFTLGKAYAGAKVTVYVQHNNGDKDTLNLTADNNGNVTFKVTGLSIYTIVAEKTATGAATTDNGAKSPTTGVDTTGVAAVAVVAAAGAACAFVALRKNN